MSHNSEKIFEDISDNYALQGGFKGAKYLLEKSWKIYLDYFLEYFTLLGGGGKKLLDVGCGAAIVSKKMVERDFNVFGVDFSSEVIKIARQYCPEADFKKSYTYKLPFPDEMFDIVICLGVFQTIIEPEKALDEMTRVLKKGGVIIIRTLNSFRPFSLDLTKGDKVFNPFQFKKLLRKRNFKNINIKGIYIFPNVVGFLNNLILKMKIYNIFNILYVPFFIFISHSFYIEAKKQ